MVKFQYIWVFYPPLGARGEEQDRRKMFILVVRFALFLLLFVLSLSTVLWEKLICWAGYCWGYCWAARTFEKNCSSWLVAAYKQDYSTVDTASCSRWDFHEAGRTARSSNKTVTIHPILSHLVCLSLSIRLSQVYSVG